MHGKIFMLCNENLHSFEISALATDFECPTCGCKYGRVDPNGGPKTTVTIDVKEPYAVPVAESWVQRLPEKEEKDAT